MDILTVRLCWIQKTSQKGSSLPSLSYVGRAQTCPLHGLPFAHPEGQRRHRQHVTADGTAQCLLSGHEGGRIEHFLRGQMLRGRLRSALKPLKHQVKEVKGPKGKQLTRSRYFQVLYSLIFTGVMAWRQNIRGLVLALRKALLETRSEQIGRQVVRQEDRRR